MIRRRLHTALITAVLPALLLLTAAAPARAACEGRDLLAELSPERRAALEEAVESQPFARGNFWRARRGDATLTLVGTYHLDDPRHDRTMSRLAPLIDAAGIVLLEAGPDEEARLLAEMAQDPSLMFITDGPTLPELLPEADWQRLSDEMRARQVPPFFAAKFKPWYVSMMLGIPACMIETTLDDMQGLDRRIQNRAEMAGIPVAGLEPHDTILTMMERIPEAMQLDMIRAALTLGDQAADHHATLAGAYFDQNARMIWEFTRDMARHDPTFSAQEVEEQYAVMEQILMTERNRAWIDVIEAAEPEGTAFVAFGALHLSGQDGVLALLERRGWHLERLTF